MKSNNNFTIKEFYHRISSH